jgi:hypothetical protein
MMVDTLFDNQNVAWLFGYKSMKDNIIVIICGEVMSDF